MRRFIAGTVLGAVLMLAGGASASSNMGNTPRSSLPRMCIIAHNAHYSDPIPCSLAYALHAQGAGNVWVSRWVKP